MDRITFSIDKQKYWAQLVLNKEYVTAVLTVYMSGDDREVLDIVWNPKSQREVLETSEVGIPLAVVKRAMSILEDYRKTASFKALLKRKPKPAPKAVKALRSQISEAVFARDHEKSEALVVGLSRHIVQSRVVLPLA